MWAKQKAFTIVELMVVIVVIGILASISTVAYNGAQQRARDTKRVHDVEVIANALTAIITSNRGDFGTSDAGYANVTIGFISTGPPAAGYETSIKDWLIQEEYLGEGVDEPTYAYNSRDYAVTLCRDTDVTENRRVVMARLENAPSQTVDQQITGNNCSGYWYTLFQNAPFSMNYAKVVDAR